MSAPRIDRVTGQFFRKGKCEVCGRATERLRTFSADSHEAMIAKGEAWTDPIRHKKCEWLDVPTEATA